MYREYKPTCIEHFFANNRKSVLKGKYVSVNGRKFLLLDNSSRKYAHYQDQELSYVQSKNFDFSRSMKKRKYDLSVKNYDVHNCNKVNKKLTDDNDVSKNDCPLNSVRKRKNDLTDKKCEVYYVNDNTWSNDSNKFEDYYLCSSCSKSSSDPPEENLAKKIKFDDSCPSELYKINDDNSEEIKFDSCDKEVINKNTLELREGIDINSNLDSQGTSNVLNTNGRIIKEKTKMKYQLKNINSSNRSKFNVNYLKRLCYITCMKALLKSSKSTQPMLKKDTESQTENYEYEKSIISDKPQQSMDQSNSCSYSEVIDCNESVHNFLKNNPFFDDENKNCSLKFQQPPQLHSVTGDNLNRCHTAEFSSKGSSEKIYVKNCSNVINHNPFLYNLYEPMTSTKCEEIPKGYHKKPQIFTDLFKNPINIE